MKPTHLLFKVLIFFVLTGLVQPVPSSYGTSPASPRPPEAEQAVRRGMAAVDQKEWRLASEHFTKAQELAPLAPDILYNLGVAHSKAGNEILASLWLKAYLEMAPSASNAQAVRQEMNRLEVRAEAKAEKLFEEAFAGAEQIPDEIGAQKRAAFANLGFARASTGRIDENKASYQNYYGQYLAGAGDFEEAQKILEKIAEDTERDALTAYILFSRISRDELDEARKAMRRLTDPHKKFEALEYLSAIYGRRLDVKALEGMLGEFQKPEEKLPVLFSLVLAHLKTGNMEAAKQISLEMESIGTSGGSVYSVYQPALLALRGEGEKAIQNLERAGGQAAYFAAVTLAWMGRSELAKKACRTAGKKSVSETGVLSQWASATVAAEEGEFQEVKRLGEQIPSESRDELYESLFWRLLGKNQPQEAEKIARFALTDQNKARWLVWLSDFYGAEGAGADAKRLLDESYRLASSLPASQALLLLSQRTAKRDGNDSGRFVREARAARWIELARYGQSIPALSDLDSHLVKVQNASFEQIPFELGIAAEAWGSAVTVMRAVESGFAKRNES